MADVAQRGALCARRIGAGATRREIAMAAAHPQVGRHAVDRDHAVARIGQARGGAQQARGIGVGGFSEQRVGIGQFDQPAGVHDRHAVRHLGHHAQIVRHQQHGQAQRDHHGQHHGRHGEHQRHPGAAQELRVMQNQIDIVEQAHIALRRG
ncbi:hypothetical protein G6F57_017251 [Rhizopus arrhizus]|nr:hypothetical protein G6F57_017251 [Rhizopus arrhizus]